MLRRLPTLRRVPTPEYTATTQHKRNGGGVWNLSFWFCFDELVDPNFNRKIEIERRAPDTGHPDDLEVVPKVCDRVRVQVTRLSHLC